MVLWLLTLAVLVGLGGEVFLPGHHVHVDEGGRHHHHAFDGPHIHRGTDVHDHHHGPEEEFAQHGKATDSVASEGTPAEEPEGPGSDERSTPLVVGGFTLDLPSDGVGWTAPVPARSIARRSGAVEAPAYPVRRPGGARAPPASPLL